jgi:hypothetical protein
VKGEWEMRRLLAVCPTRGRLKRCEEMICSAKNTSSIADFVFYIDKDDPQWRNYMYLLSSYEKPGVNFFIGERKTTTELYNQAFNSFPDYEFYCLTNDDFIFRTYGWDKTLCERGKISYGNDLLGGINLPTCPVIDGDIIRSIGWLQMPLLNYMYGDSVWKVIGLKLGILRYVPSVVIEHNHWINRKAEMDDVYKNTNSAETYHKDEKAFKQWNREMSESDCSKIRVKLGLC